MSTPSAERVRLFLVDDHAFVRLGLRAFFAELDGVEIVGEAADGVHALDELDSLAAAGTLPDVVLMDLQLPGLDGIAVTQEVTRRHPQVRVVALTSYADVDRVRSALRAGAVGYVLKDAGPDGLLAAVDAAHRGLTSIDAALSRRLAEPPAPLSVGATTLTPREWEVLALVGEGLSNQEIATCLVVTERTARTHVSRVLTKLSLASRTQAALWFRQHSGSQPQ